jgi:hypothetical protein
MNPSSTVEYTARKSTSDGNRHGLLILVAAAQVFEIDADKS